MSAPMGSWYENAVGDSFEVYEWGTGWVMAEDYEQRTSVHYATWRHIDKTDCFEVSGSIQDTPSLPMNNSEEMPNDIKAWIEEWSGVYAFENGSEAQFDALKSQYEDACHAFYSMLLKNNKLNGK